MRITGTKRYIIIGLKILLSAGLFWYVLAQTRLSEIFDLLGNVDTGLFVVVIGLIIFEKVLACYRWYLLLIAVNRPVPFLKLFRIYLVSLGLGSFSPGGLAGDALRIYAVAAVKGEIPAVASSLVTDRFFGFLSLLAICLVCLFLASEDSPDIIDLITSISLIAALVMIGFFMLFSSKTGMLLAKYNHIRYVGKIADTVDKVRLLCRDWRIVSRGLLVSTLVQFVRVIYVYALALSIGIETQLVYFMIFIPIVYFMMQLPISINGIGVSQGLYVLFFGPRGMNATEAFTLSTSIMLLGYVVVLIGVVLYLTGGLKYKAGDNPLQNPATKRG